jgi:starch-binding outer membrane protein, SusD/RagB family
MKIKFCTLLFALAFCGTGNTIYAQKETLNLKTGGSENIIQPAILDQSNSIEVPDFSQQQMENDRLNAFPSNLNVSNLIPSPGSPEIETMLNQTDSVTDIDGNVYQTVQIGDRWWMAENLKVTKYRNGDPIEDGTGIDTLFGLDEPKYYFYYNNDPANDSIYGKLYTWYVADDERNVCPTGWYMPTYDDLIELRDTLDPNGGWENIAGGKMKTTGTIEDGTGLWYAPNVGATNESGFSAVPSGFFYPWSQPVHSFAQLGERFTMVSSTEFSSDLSFDAGIWNAEEVLYINNILPKTAGVVLRCVKNTSANVQAPSIITLPADAITQFSADINGEVTNNGGESVSNRWFYWGLNENPTASDNRTYNGSGSGAFSSTLNTRPSRTYYYKAYAKNSVGTVSGQELSFTTPAMDDATALSVASSSFLDYWQAIKQYNIGMTAEVMADHTTCSWGNFGWYENSAEPRTTWNNMPYYFDADMTLDLWWSVYNLVAKLNDVLYALDEENLQIGPGGADSAKVVATMYLIRGLALGQIGLTFDQAWIAQDNSELEDFDLEPWQDVLEAAIADLEEAIAICTDNSFSWGYNVVNGMLINNTYMKQLASSYAARFLALGARNQDQNNELSWTIEYDWSDVLGFANDGISTDFAPLGNGFPWDGGTWWDLHIKYLRQPGWGRVDCRVLNLLDPEYPVRYPTDNNGYALDPPQVHPGLQPGEASTIDTRFTNDFQFLPTNSFLPQRGGYHYSHYRHSRYDYPPTTSTEGLHMGESLGPLRELRAYENELIKAEALARTGNVSGAATILNDPNLPRKNRGNLPDVAANLEDVLNATFYERDIELFHNGYLISFCDMRRRDMLQRGTPLHFPLPGRLLQDLELENYTYGGYFNADGINTSNGGEWIKPYYHFAELNIEITGTGQTYPEEGAHLPNKGEHMIYAFQEPGSAFQKWIVNNDDEFFNNPLVLDLQEEILVECVFTSTAQPQFELSLAVEGIGSILPDSGTYYLLENQSILLNALQTDPDWPFINWTTVDGTLISSDSSFVYTMPANYVSLTANFGVELFELNLVSNPQEGGLLTGDGLYAAGEEVTVTAITNEGYVFVNWTENGTVISDTAQFIYTMPPNDATLTANFEPLYSLNLDVSPENSGTVSGDGLYPEGQEVTITAQANTNYYFVSWNDENGNVVSTNANYTFNMPANDLLLTAVFEEYLYELELIADPANGGEVSGGGFYPAGEEVTVTATANAGFEFLNWTENGIAISYSPQFVYTMPANDVTLTANFIPEQTPVYILTLIAEPEFGGSVYGAGLFPEGSNVTVMAEANEGYEFVSWNDEDGNVVSTNANYSFIMPDDNLTLSALFDELEQFTVTITIEGSGVVEVNGETYTNPITVYEGTVLELSAIEDEGWLFVEWSGDLESTDPNEIIDVTDDMDITATFEFVNIVSQELLSSVKLYPNPFNNYITIEANGVLSAVVIRNVVGKQMASVHAEGQENVRINTSGFARGIYIVELYSTCQQRVARKILKY